jgi:nucleotide-binding universal stress UspA family protein
MKKILIATDLSGRSDRALQRGMTLAREWDAEIEIIHVVDGDMPQKLIDQQEEHAKRALNEQIAAIPQTQARPVTTHIIRGQDYLEITRRSLAWGADLIVLGISRNASRGLFQGTTSERIIRFGRTPALIVKQPYTVDYARILVAVDLSVHSRRALAFAADTFPNAEIFCVHATHEPFIGFLGKDAREELVNAEQQNFLRSLDDELQRTHSSDKGRFHTIVKTGDPVPVILSSIEELKADLLVTGTHSRTNIAHAVLGSVAETCIAEVPIDILVAKA